MWNRMGLDMGAGTKHLTRLLIACALALLAVTAGVLYARGGRPAPGGPTQTDVGSGFTYQGQLQRDGRPVDDACWFAFRLHDHPVTGTQIGDAITTTAPLTVSDGLFSVVLNAGGEFGAQAFKGDARWLDARVKCPSDPTFTALGRQPLTAAPYALYAVSAGNADTVDGVHASGLARVGRYAIPGWGGTVTIPIPHYNAFQITIGEAHASPQKAAWIAAVENDRRLAWTGIDASGSVVVGTCQLALTDTIVTLGSGITLRCPGTDNYEVVLTSDDEDVRSFLVW